MGIHLNFFKKIIGGYKSFSWGYWYPCFGLLVMSALGFKARVDPFCMLPCLCDPQIHLWCDTCWQHGSPAFLIHLPADMSASIGGGSGHELHPGRLISLKWAWIKSYYKITVWIVLPAAGKVVTVVVTISAAKVVGLNTAFHGGGTFRCLQ